VQENHKSCAFAPDEVDAVFSLDLVSDQRLDQFFRFWLDLDTVEGLRTPFYLLDLADLQVDCVGLA